MINYVEKYHPYIYGILGLASLSTFILQRVPFLSLRVGSATPLLLLPLLIVISCFLKEWVGFCFGILFGIGLDIFMADSRIFNTVFFSVIGVGAGLLFHYFFNKNIKAAILGGFLICLTYFLTRWFIFTLIAGDSSPFLILFKYEIPSLIYTATFVIPFYYFLKYLCKKYIIHNS